MLEVGEVSSGARKSTESSLEAKSGAGGSSQGVSTIFKFSKPGTVSAWEAGLKDICTVGVEIFHVKMVGYNGFFWAQTQNLEDLVS